MYVTGVNISQQVGELARTTVDEAAGIKEISAAITDILEQSNSMADCACANARDVERLAGDIMKPD